MSKRTLKIEEHGTTYKPARRPSMIRLKGQWLRDAGFAPGQSVELTVVSPGVIELRLTPIGKLPDPEAAAIMGRIDRAMAKTEIV